MGWAFRAYGWREGVYRVLVGKPKGRRPLRTPRHRWVDNIRTDLQEVGCGYMDWIGLAQDRDRWRMLVSAVLNLRVPWNAGNFLTSCKPVSFSRRTLHHGVSKFLDDPIQGCSPPSLSRMSTPLLIVIIVHDHFKSLVLWFTHAHVIMLLSLKRMRILFLAGMCDNAVRSLIQQR